VRVLFDQGTPVPLRHHLPHHSIRTAFELGWSALKNGELLARAEADGFEALVTTDRNLKYQQSLADRRIAIVVLGTTSWPRIQASASLVLRAIDSAVPGGYAEVLIP
jgi:hypothetical protein